MTTSSKLFLSAGGFMVLSGERWLGAIAPVGGIAFLAAWALFVVAVLRA